MQQFQATRCTIHYETLGSGTGRVFVWAHGWGQTHQNFAPLAQSFQQAGTHIMVDFPGFGASPAPEQVMGTEDYADAMAELLKAKGLKKVIWVGHSFGCRVGIQIAARHPDLIAGMFLIAAAGLKRRRPPHKAIYLKARIYLFKTLKKLIPLKLINEEWLRKTFGGGDYKNVSGVMRSIFVRVVNEDLSDPARHIGCPVTLLYGTADTETPLDTGMRLNKLIAGSDLVQLEGQDHYSVLSGGRHLVAHSLTEFIEAL